MMKDEERNQKGTHYDTMYCFSSMQGLRGRAGMEQ